MLSKRDLLRIVLDACMIVLWGYGAMRNLFVVFRPASVLLFLLMGAAFAFDLIRTWVQGSSVK